jgi:hypothetical protein
LAEDAAKGIIFDGIRRSVLTKMGLRDRPILDRYQDEIFRLPIKGSFYLLARQEAVRRPRSSVAWVKSSTMITWTPTKGD